MDNIYVEIAIGITMVAIVVAVLIDVSGED